MKKNNQSIYRYIVAYCKLVDSSKDFTEMECAIATVDNAPVDAVYKDASGTWKRFNEFPQHTQELIKKHL